MNTVNDLINSLFSCPCGRSGWKQFEDVCLDILCYLFVPPLAEPKIQPRTYSGIDRRDAAFPNRNFDSKNIWGYLLREFNARLILVEFKNYLDYEIGKEEVDQLRNYMTEPMGRLALMVCSKLPNKAAHIRRNTIYSTEKKVILFITKEQLKEMLFIKERGEEPSDLIIDLVEWFYLQHE
ncbi:hypothetical protein [Clostridium cadaveris]|uniref:hypothetical protein n=1 Tax=Clostridium cadaveris TaxID=1529 RepID=UPI0015B39731|nr:hypothetical protein [Clostridium cadaveris]NWK10756.1 hypothetical protein [Clostridium cadaveris]